MQQEKGTFFRGEYLMFCLSKRLYNRKKKTVEKGTKYSNQSLSIDVTVNQF